MTTRAKEFSDRLKVFNDQVIAWLQNISEEDWHKRCDGEDWTVGVVARHIGAGHFAIFEMAKLIIAGQPLPELTMEKIIQMGNDHAREHADCKKDEVLSILDENGKALVTYVAGLNDQDLDRKAYLALFEGEVSAEQLMEMVVLESGGEHLASMQKTVGA